MININLLPWREQQRQSRQRQFLSMLLMTSILGGVLVFMLSLVYDQKIKHQQLRNGLLGTEIHKLNSRIETIEELAQLRARLISRKQVIERLQASRSMTAELLNKLAKSIPPGVTLTSLRQKGTTVALAGTSQSNAKVSAYLRELEHNDLFLDPQLGFVRAVTNSVAAIEPYQFTIEVSLRPPHTTDDKKVMIRPNDAGRSE